MGARPVTTPQTPAPSSWKLKRPHDARAQGLVVNGFSSLPSAEALFLRFDWPENEPGGPGARGKGAWLQTLDQVAPATNAEGKDKNARAAALAFTWTGLQKLGLAPDALATFSQPFREGMYQEDRLRRLGDKVKDEWQDSVIKGGPRWSANIPARKNELVPGDIGPPEPDEREVATPITVHTLLVLYEKDQNTARAWANAVEAKLAPHGVTIVHRLSLDLRFDANNIAREHFGFADGLSQPIPYDEKSGNESAPDCVVFSDGRPVKRDDVHGVPLGEILLGHTNAHHEKAPGPIVRFDELTGDMGLVAEGAPVGFRNFGLDGSYLVVRELQQRVADFWKSLQSGAALIRAHDPGATHVTADWLAERVIGRTIDGHLLCPGGAVLPPDQNGQPQNDFRFKHDDPEGAGCPLGSHVRRANPRDSLAKDAASAQTLLDAANSHRILRRGRKFGTTLTDRYNDDNTERGLLFMCLNTDIARQFEFVQQTWLLNRNFHTLFDETDPLVGPKGKFTIRERPLRRIVDVETFIQCAGGEYFFLPSLPAVKYLAQL
jgi:deferrochelatase/peroxidase EfeB